ncbi:MAG: 4-phosphopantetheinyl transferase [Bryobacterales bacterium]|nr:4-phosphopantetheinyl transferase [Bryobacterales bacterium]
MPGSEDRPLTLDRDSLTRLVAPDFRLPGGEVHVWRVSLDSLFFYHRNFLKTLTLDELLQAQRLRSEVEQLRFVARRGFLRVILGCYMEVAPGDVNIRYSQHGKPQLSNKAKGGLRFSVAHSGHEALYAFSHHREVGVDIERLRTVENAANVVQKNFSAFDALQFQSAPAAERTRVLFRLWTSHDALFKARGGKLAVPMLDYSQGWLQQAPPAPGKPVTDSKNRWRWQGWSIQELDLSPGYVGAVAAQGYDWRLCILHLLIP